MKQLTERLTYASYPGDVAVRLLGAVVLAHERHLVEVDLVGAEQLAKVDLQLAQVLPGLPARTVDHLPTGGRCCVMKEASSKGICH
eukprot:3634734-Pleurochrysis_carterae.AAC.2